MRFYLNFGLGQPNIGNSGEMFKKYNIETKFEKEDTLLIQIHWHSLTNELGLKFGQMLPFLGLTYIASSYIDSMAWFWFSLLFCTFIFALSIRSSTQARRSSYILFDKLEGKIKSDGKKDMLIKNIKAVRITILQDDDGNEDEFALTLRTNNANKPYKMLIGEEEEMRSLQKMLSSFLDVPMQQKKGDHIQELK